MLAEIPEVAGSRHRLGRRFGHRILVAVSRSRPAGFIVIAEWRHQFVELCGREAEQVEIEILAVEFVQQPGQQFVVPARRQSQLVVGDDVGAALRPLIMMPPSTTKAPQARVQPSLMRSKSSIPATRSSDGGFL